MYKRKRKRSFFYFERRALAGIRHTRVRLRRLKMLEHRSILYRRYSIRVRASLNKCLPVVERSILRHWMFRKLMRLRKRIRKYFAMSRRRAQDK